MYKFERYRQLGLIDFNQPVSLKMTPENRWVKSRNHSAGMILKSGVQKCQKELPESGDEKYYI